MTSQHLTSYTFDIKNMVLPHYMASVVENPDSVYYKQPVAAAPAGRKAYTRKPKAKAKSKKKASSGAITKAYALNYMSPFYSSYPPADADSFGNFVCLNNVARFTLSTTTDKDTVLVFCPGIQSFWTCIAWNDLGQVLGAIQESPTRKMVSDPPTTSRTLRGSLRFRNITSSQNIGGIVHVLTTSSAIGTNGHWAGTTSGNVTMPFAAELLNSAAQHSRSRSYTAQEMSTGINEVVSAICSNSDYHDYKSFDTGSTIADLQGAFDSQTTHMSMNNIIISLPKTDVVNTYEFTLATQTAGRYPMNTVISSFAKPAPKSSTPDFIKKVAEAQGSNGSDLIQHDPLIAMLGGGGKKKA